jgi:hypothetical protein
MATYDSLTCKVYNSLGKAEVAAAILPANDSHRPLDGVRGQSIAWAADRAGTDGRRRRPREHQQKQSK